MAKKSMLMRNAKRAKIVKRYAKRRAALKEIIRDPKANEDEQLAAQQSLQALPRDANPVRAAQPLRDHRPPARLLSEIRARSQQAARSGDARRDSGLAQG